MNDRQLHDELERRSASANVNRDWARRELLPAVSAAIETRPQRVVTSRGPALAGLAGAAAMLLILVVALPRFSSAPPATDQASGRPPGTSAPDAIQPEILTAQEFAVGVLTGRLRSSTVLVDGTIGARPLLFGPGCHVSPPRSCLMGRLEGTDPSVDVLSGWLATGERDPAVPASDQIWTWWHLPSGPITGTLLLSVNGDGVIEFLGQVDAANGSEPATVAEATQIDIESLALDEVVLIEGWLWSAERPDGPIQVSIDCAWPAASPIPGLPNYFCQPHDAVVDYQRNTAVSVTAPEPRLDVQRGAAQTYGGTVGAEPHVFAVAPRLHGGDCDAAEPPCWKWEVVGRLSDTSSVDPSPAPPRPTSDLPPAETPQGGTTVECADRAEGARWPMSATIHDATGLLDSCEVVYGFAEELLVDQPVIRNPQGDLRLIGVTWEGSACDGHINFSLTTIAGSYSLRGKQEHIGPCIAVAVGRALLLHLLEDTIASELSMSWESPPTPMPTPSIETRQFDCDGAPSGPESAGIAFEDHTGLVSGCSVPDAVDGDPAVLPSSDPNVQTFSWTIPCATDVSDTSLSFWAREAPPDVGLHRPFVLIADRSAWKPGLWCRTALGTRVVQVVFGAPIATEEIDFVLLNEGRGGDTAEFDRGYFWLTLTSDKLEYAAGEQIEVSAELMYDGPTPIALSGVFSLVNGFGIEQLGGPLAMSPGWDMPCIPHEMRAYEPLVVPLQKSASWGPDDPNAAFYREWSDDPVLRLPAGTWLVTAYSDFVVGTGCSGERVELTGSVVVVVR